MKHRVKAFLMAACMTASLLTAGITSLAADKDTEAVTEAVTEKETETAAAETEAKTEAESDVEKAVEDAENLETEETETAEEASVELKVLTEDGKYAAQYENMKVQAIALIESISQMSDADMEAIIENDEAFSTAAVESWMASKEELGEYQGITAMEVEEEDKTVTLTAKVAYANHTATVTVMADMKEMSFTEMAWNVDYSLGENMQRAGMNTVMGIGIVFLMLLFLSFLISLFKYIPGAGGQQKKAPAAKAPAPAPAAPAAPVAEEEDLTDDLELVAVITAAIAASEGTSSDGFVVRSIKKSNRRWQKA